MCGQNWGQRGESTAGFVPPPPKQKFLYETPLIKLMYFCLPDFKNSVYLEILMKLLYPRGLKGGLIIVKYFELFCVRKYLHVFNTTDT